MAKKVKQPAGQFDSIYYYTKSYETSGDPAIVAAMQLGDNSAFGRNISGAIARDGIHEYSLNGVCGNLSWGTKTIDGIRYINSDVNYPAPSYCPVHLSMPPSDVPQTPAKLAVGTRPTIYYQEDPHGAIKFVVVEAFVHLHGEAPPDKMVTVQWHNLAIVFIDVAGNRTTNPIVQTPLGLPGACVGQLCPTTATKAALTPSPTNYYCFRSDLVAIPSSALIGGAIGVEIRGAIELVSTDPTFSNYGQNLSPASMEGRLLVWQSDPGGAGSGKDYPTIPIPIPWPVPIRPVPKVKPAPVSVSDESDVPSHKRKRRPKG